ncbi:hypothetical protein ACA910_005415 [Epithemia clementina (nom. ined.)]
MAKGQSKGGGSTDFPPLVPISSHTKPPPSSQPPVTPGENPKASPKSALASAPPATEVWEFTITTLLDYKSDSPFADHLRHWLMYHGIDNMTHFLSSWSLPDFTIGSPYMVYRIFGDPTNTEYCLPPIIIKNLCGLHRYIRHVYDTEQAFVQQQNIDEDDDINFDHEFESISLPAFYSHTMRSFQYFLVNNPAHFTKSIPLSHSKYSSQPFYSSHSSVTPPVPKPVATKNMMNWTTSAIPNPSSSPSLSQSAKMEPTPIAQSRVFPSSPTHHPTPVPPIDVLVTAEPSFSTQNHTLSHTALSYPTISTTIIPSTSSLLQSSCHVLEHSIISLSPDSGELMMHVHLLGTSHCPSVDKSSSEPDHHGEETPRDLSTPETTMKQNMENNRMNNQTLLSPLQGKCYNMTKKRLDHIAALTNKMGNNNKPLTTSSISSQVHLCKSHNEPSSDVSCSESSPDTDVYHSKVQDSLRSDYFEAFSQLKSFLAIKNPISNKVACLHGEKPHSQQPRSMEQPNEEKTQNIALKFVKQYTLKNHPSPLHPHIFRVPATYKHPLLIVPYKVTLDRHVRNHNTFCHTLKFSTANIADDDPIKIPSSTSPIHPNNIYLSTPEDDDPTQSPSSNSLPHPDNINKPPKPPNLYGELSAYDPHSSVDTSITIWGDITTNENTITVGNKLWGSAISHVSNKASNKLWGDTANATTVTIGNNLWGDNNTTVNTPLLNTDCIFMAHHDWGDHTHFLDFIHHKFHGWQRAPNITQALVHLLGIFMSQVDWRDIHSFFSIIHITLYCHLGLLFTAAKIAVEQIMDLRTTLWYLSVLIQEKTYMFGVNKSVITSGTLPHSLLNKKHNALAYHRVREAVAANIVGFYWIDSKNNQADILNKHWDNASVHPTIKELFDWRGVLSWDHWVNPDKKGSDTIPPESSSSWFLSC